MKFRKHTTRWRLGGLTALALVFALVMQVATPFNAFSASPDLPRPGEALHDPSIVTALVGVRLDGSQGIIRIVITCPERLATIDRFEVIVVGGTVELHGTAFITYGFREVIGADEGGAGVRVSNVSQSYHPIHEVPSSHSHVHRIFADGERLTLFVDHDSGINSVEMYVPIRMVASADDSMLYHFPVSVDGQRVAPSESLFALASSNANSPYRASRPAGDGSVLDIFTSPIGIQGNLMERMPRSNEISVVSVERPMQTPTLDPTPPPTDQPIQLNLATASNWAHDGITRAVSLGLVPQNLQSNFTQPTTRAEFTAFAVALYETATGRTITGRQTFTDTNDVNVEKMAYIGVVSGVGGGRFDPNARLTREQAAVMLSRLANAIGRPLPQAAPTFADNASISAWAVDSVGAIQAAGIMGGVGNNRFAPQDPYTREQSIITILRLLD